MDIATPHLDIATPHLDIATPHLDIATPHRVLIPTFLVSRIGEMAMQLDLLAKTKELGWREPFTPIVMAPPGTVCNPCLLDYYRPWVGIADTGSKMRAAAELAHQGAVWDPTKGRLENGDLEHEDVASVVVNAEWERQGREPLVKLRPGHVERGRNWLRNRGIADDEEFVAVHVRTPEYLREPPTSHHRFRNADFETYKRAISLIYDHGLRVVYMQEGNPDWVDVFLLASAKFLLCTTSGPWVVASCFGTPIVQTNVFPFSERPWSSRDLFIPKIYRRGLEAAEFPVPFRECLTEPLARQFMADEVEALGITVQDNTEGDIFGLVGEKLGESESDPELVMRFNMLYGAGMAPARPGTRFLRKYRYLMEDTNAHHVRPAEWEAGGEAAR